MAPIQGATFRSVEVSDYPSRRPFDPVVLAQCFSNGLLEAAAQRGIVRELIAGIMGDGVPGDNSKFLETTVPHPAGPFHENERCGLARDKTYRVIARFQNACFRGCLEEAWFDTRVGRTHQTAIESTLVDLGDRIAQRLNDPTRPPVI
jgi:hypothetical protein